MEQELLRRWPEVSGAVELREWYSDAASYLLSLGDDGHWWCEHGGVVSPLLSVLHHAEQPAVQRLWDALKPQLAGCVHCVHAYHAAKRAQLCGDAEGGASARAAAEEEEEGEEEVGAAGAAARAALDARKRLAVLDALDAERLCFVLQGGTAAAPGSSSSACRKGGGAQAADSDRGPGAAVGLGHHHNNSDSTSSPAGGDGDNDDADQRVSRALLALHEVLSYDDLLMDEGVDTALQRSMMPPPPPPPPPPPLPDAPPPPEGGSGGGGSNGNDDADGGSGGGEVNLWDRLSWRQCGAFPGLFRLLGHASSDVRSKASAALQDLQPAHTLPLHDWPSAAPYVSGAVGSWLPQLLAGAPPAAQTAAAASRAAAATDARTASACSDAHCRRPKVQPQLLPSWLGLKRLMQLMEPAAIDGMLAHFPHLGDTLLRSLVHPQQAVARHAAGCAHMALTACGPGFWTRCAAFIPSDAAKLAMGAFPGSSSSSSRGSSGSSGAADAHRLAIMTVIEAMVQCLLGAGLLQDATALVRFLLVDVALGSGSVRGVSQLTATMAARAVLRRLRGALALGWPTSLWAELAGRFVCHHAASAAAPAAAAPSASPAAAGAAASTAPDGWVRDDAAEALCSILRIDGCLLAAALEPWKLRDELGRASLLPPAAYCGTAGAATAAAAARVLLLREKGAARPPQQEQAWTCCPAYWQAAATCSDAAVVGALLAVAGHLAYAEAPSEPPPPPLLPGGGAAASGTGGAAAVGGGADGCYQQPQGFVPEARLVEGGWVQGPTLPWPMQWPHPLLAAATPDSAVADAAAPGGVSGGFGVPVEQHAALLLYTLRRAATSLLLCQDAGGRQAVAPLLRGEGLASSDPNAAAAARDDLCGTSCAALVRLMVGADAGLREVAAQALCRATCTRNAQDAFRELASYDSVAVAALLDALSDAVARLQGYVDANAAGSAGRQAPGGSARRQPAAQPKATVAATGAAAAAAVAASLFGSKLLLPLLQVAVDLLPAVSAAATTATTANAGGSYVEHLASASAARIAAWLWDLLQPLLAWSSAPATPADAIRPGSHQERVFVCALKALPTLLALQLGGGDGNNATSDDNGDAPAMHRLPTCLDHLMRSGRCCYASAALRDAWAAALEQLLPWMDDPSAVAPPRRTELVQLAAQLMAAPPPTGAAGAAAAGSAALPVLLLPDAQRMVLARLLPEAAPGNLAAFATAAAAATAAAVAAAAGRQQGTARSTASAPAVATSAAASTSAAAPLAAASLMSWPKRSAPTGAPRHAPGPPRPDESPATGIARQPPPQPQQTRPLARPAVAAASAAPARPGAASASAPAGSLRATLPAGVSEESLWQQALSSRQASGAAAGTSAGGKTGGGGGANWEGSDVAEMLRKRKRQAIELNLGLSSSSAPAAAAAAAAARRPPGVGYAAGGTAGGGGAQPPLARPATHHQAAGATARFGAAAAGGNAQPPGRPPLPPPPGLAGVASGPPTAATRLSKGTVQMLSGPVRGAGARKPATTGGASRQQQQSKAAPVPAAPYRLVMEEIYQEICCWDLHDDLLLAARGLRPTSPSAAYGGADLAAFSVPTSFAARGYSHYARTFRRLLMEELHASVRCTLEEAAASGGSSAGSGSVAVTVRKVQHNIELLHVVTVSLTPGSGGGGGSSSRRGSEDGAADAASSSGASDASWGPLRQDDLVLLTSLPLAGGAASLMSVHQQQQRQGQQQQGQQQQLQPGRGGLLAIVSDVFTERGGGRCARLHVAVPDGGLAASRVQALLADGRTLHATVMDSLVTHFRQFQALCSFPQLPDRLKSFLLSPSGGGPPPPPLAKALEAAPSLQAALSERFNASQQQAVALATDRLQHVALVQGPPGSGKTTTIVGMISALLASSGRGGSSSVGTKAQLEGPCTAAPGGKPASAGSSLAAPAAVPPTTDRRTQDGSNGGNDASTSVRAKGAASTTPSTSATAAAAAAEPARPASASSRPAVRVLMCAQSNAAVDELVHRLVTDGVWTAGGGRRRPTVVRVGRLDATHEAVKRYHIDVLEQQKAPQGGGSAAAVGSSGGGGAAAAAKAAAEAGRLRERLAELAGRVRLLEAEQQTLEALLTSGSNAGGGGGGGNSNDGAPTTNGSGSSSGIKRRKLANGRAAAAAAEGSSSASAADHQQQLASVREEVTGLREQQQELSRLLAEADAKSKATSATANSRAAEAAGRRELRAAVLASAEVVACTLSVAGSELIAASAGGGAAAAAPASAAAAVAAPSVGGGGSAFSKGVISAIATAAGSSSSSSSSHKFDALIIDEAAQAVEPAALVPLHLVKPGARVILVGDAKQLPPTLLSRLAGAAAAFCNSLFERLQRGGCRAVMLTEQYRMHPAISRFPASFFYGSDLVDGQGVCGDSRSLPCHALPPFGPLAVFDVADGRERRGGGSGGAGGYMSNREEAELAAALLQQALEQRGCGGGRLGSVAVLTPYRAQRSQLAASFRSAVRDEAVLKRVEFATVDAFQGREADVVIFSAVRAQPQAAAAGAAALGFLTDARRMNVALTRAKRALWIVCHAATLRCSPAWKALLDDAAERLALFTAPPPPYRRLMTACQPVLQQSAADAWGASLQEASVEADQMMS